jgi:hypothetical protein
MMVASRSGTPDPNVQWIQFGVVREVVRVPLEATGIENDRGGVGSPKGGRTAIESWLTPNVAPGDALTGLRTEMTE